MFMNKGMISYNQSRLSVIFNKIVMAFIDVFCHPICINGLFTLLLWKIDAS